MSTIRTFVAVEPSGEIRTRAAHLIERLARAGADVKWVQPEQAHWTLQFLGNIDSNKVPEVCAAVGRSVARVSPFLLTAGGAGAFPHAGRPRTVWMGVGEGGEAVVALRNVVAESLTELGFHRETRRFVPHLTLGRVRQNDRDQASHLSQLLEQQATFSAGTMMVEEAVIFASYLARGGPIYESVGRALLGVGWS